MPDSSGYFKGIVVPDVPFIKRRCEACCHMLTNGRCLRCDYTRKTRISEIVERYTQGDDTCSEDLIPETVDAESIGVQTV